MSDRYEELSRLVQEAAEAKSAEHTEAVMAYCFKAFVAPEEGSRELCEVALRRGHAAVHEGKSPDASAFEQSGDFAPVTAAAYLLLGNCLGENYPLIANKSGTWREFTNRYKRWVLEPRKHDPQY